LVYGVGILGAGYLLNPGLGIFELFPDSIPIIGNLDEGTATIAIWYGMVEFLENRRKKNK